MARPPSLDEIVTRLMSDGRMVTTSELESMGVSRAGLTRLVDRGVLSKESRGLYVLAGWSANDPFAVLAKRYGGVPGEPRGILCLQAATHLHELTDMSAYNIRLLEITLAHGTTKTVPADVDARIVRSASPYPLSDLVWREFGGHGIHVTSPARTVCDIYAPWAGPFPEGMAHEALGRLVVLDVDMAKLAVKRAHDLGWGQPIGRAFSSMQMVRRYSEVPEDEQVGMGSVRL